MPAPYSCLCVDPELWALCSSKVSQQLKSEKKAYREAHAEMRALKTEVDYLQTKAEAAKANMLSAYEAWISANPDPSGWGTSSQGGASSARRTPRQMPSKRYPLPEALDCVHMKPIYIPFC